MTTIDNERILIRAVLNVCQRLSIDSERLLSSLGFEPSLCTEHQPNLSQVIEDNHALIQFLQIYLWLDSICGGDVEFVNYWLDCENKQFNAKPRQLLFSQSGLEQLFDYFGLFNFMIKSKA
jgi:hypothetical protein